jgi:16S rRNA (guanine1207-N2)-methyltransferase
MANPDRLALAFETGALAIPAEGAVVVLRAEPSRFLDAVPAGRLRCVQTFRPVFDALRHAGHPVATEAAGPAAMVVVHLTRSRPESLGNVARALDLLVPGGTLVVTGAKTDGIDSIAKLVAGALPGGASYAKAHGRVLWTTRPARLPAGAAAWAAAAAPARTADGFVTAAGMFSAEGVDPGSRRLAETFAGRLRGRVADLGAGWGWLAHAALARCPEIAALDLFEAESLALDAARQNVADPRAAFHWADVARLGPEDGRYDWVISNPPFHQGRAAEPGLGAGFIAAGARILKPDGRLLLVANRQLPYEATLAATFRRCEKLAEDGVYKLLQAERPVRPAH